MAPTVSNSVHEGNKKFVSAVSGLFLVLIYHGLGAVVHLLLLKFSMPYLVRSVFWKPTTTTTLSLASSNWSKFTLDLFQM